MKNIIFVIVLLFFGCGDSNNPIEIQNNNDNLIGTERTYQDTIVSPGETKEYYLDVIKRCNITSSNKFEFSANNGQFQFDGKEIILVGIDFGQVAIKNNNAYPIRIIIDLRSY